MVRGHQRNGETASLILDIAEKLIQQRGFNGFSYADISGELRITTASLHYHFAGKAELGRALIERYRIRFTEALAGVERDLPDARQRLEAYANLYAAVLRENRLCLCGMLAAEYQTLPETMRDSVLRFFDDNVDWLTRVLEAGQRDGTVYFSGPAVAAAKTIVGGLEGAMLIARPYADVDGFQASVRQLLSGFAPKAGADYFGAR